MVQYQPFTPMMYQLGCCHVLNISNVVSSYMNIVCFVFFQPLMVRFQAAYKAHLLKQQEKVNLELRELVSRLVISLLHEHV